MYRCGMKQVPLLINSLSLLGNRSIQAIATFALTTVIARNLGADRLGQYILAIGYYSIFVTFFGQGLRTLCTRELARDSAKTPTYLVSGMLLQLFLSIIAYVLLGIVVFLMPYSAETSTICYIMGLAVIPFALSNITEAIFQAQERMHLIAASTAPIYLLRTALMIWVALHWNFAIASIAAIMVASEAIVLVVQWFILTRTVQPKWNIDRPFIVNCFQAAKTLFIIDGIGIIAGRLDVVLLSIFGGGEAMVGIYGAIKQLVQPFEIICSSLCSAIFPRLSSSVLLGRQAQRDSTEKFLDILLCILLPLIPTVFFYYGDAILIFMYKNREFIQGETPLKIMAVTVVLYPAIRLFNYVLLANNLEKYNLIQSAITTTIGGTIGLLLIPQYQLIGAAGMGVSMSICACTLSTYFIYKHLFRLRWVKILLRPLVITTLMLLILFVLGKFHFNLLSNLAISISFYLFTAVLLLMHQSGKLTTIGQSFSKRS
jgi:O-antigen/teichoic acid export membrane protein